MRGRAWEGQASWRAHGGHGGVGATSKSPGAGGEAESGASSVAEVTGGNREPACIREVGFVCQPAVCGSGSGGVGPVGIRRGARGTMGKYFCKNRPLRMVILSDLPSRHAGQIATLKT